MKDNFRRLVSLLNFRREEDSEEAIRFVLRSSRSRYAKLKGIYDTSALKIWGDTVATKPFMFGNITASIASPSEQTALSAVRYVQRVLCARPALISGRRVNLAGVPEFALILAHVRDPKNFPFVIPDPLAHPEDVAVCWDVYLDSDPLLWGHLFRAIDPPTSPRERMDTYWSQAMRDFEVMLKSGLIRPRQGR